MNCSRRELLRSCLASRGADFETIVVDNGSAGDSREMPARDFPSVRVIGDTENQHDEAGEVLWPDGCAAMYKRAMLDGVGGFDEDVFAYADDAELGLRARIAGWTCWYAPDAVVRRHRGSTPGVRSPRRLELIERNRALLAAKLFSWSLLWLNGAYYAARLSAGAWASARDESEMAWFRGPGGKLRAAAALLRGDLKALPLLPRMLRKRREVRRIARLSPREVRKLILGNRISLKALSRPAA